MKKIIQALDKSRPFSETLNTTAFVNLINLSDVLRAHAIGERKYYALVSLDEAITDTYLKLRFRPVELFFEDPAPWVAARDNFVRYVEEYFWPLPAVKGLNAVHRQGCGLVNALYGEELEVGDQMIWNSGATSEIVSIDKETRTQITFDTEYETGNGKERASRTVKREILYGVRRQLERVFETPFLDIRPERFSEESGIARVQIQDRLWLTIGWATVDGNRVFQTRLTSYDSRGDQVIGDRDFETYTKLEQAVKASRSGVENAITDAIETFDRFVFI